MPDSLPGGPEWGQPQLDPVGGDQRGAGFQEELRLLKSEEHHCVLGQRGPAARQAKWCSWESVNILALPWGGKE